MMVLKQVIKSALIAALKLENSLVMLILGHGMLVWGGT